MTKEHISHRRNDKALEDARRNRPCEKGCCRCGASDHLRITHHSCRLNANNKMKRMQKRMEEVRTLLRPLNINNKELMRQAAQGVSQNVATQQAISNDMNHVGMISQSNLPNTFLSPKSQLSDSFLIRQFQLQANQVDESSKYNSGKESLGKSSENLQQLDANFSSDRRSHDIQRRFPHLSKLLVSQQSQDVLQNNIKQMIQMHQQQPLTGLDVSLQQLQQKQFQNPNSSVQYPHSATQRTNPVQWKNQMGGLFDFRSGLVFNGPIGPSLVQQQWPSSIIGASQGLLKLDSEETNDRGEQSQRRQRSDPRLETIEQTLQSSLNKNHRSIGDAVNRKVLLGANSNSGAVLGSSPSKTCLHSRSYSDLSNYSIRSGYSTDETIRRTKFPDPNSKTKMQKKPNLNVDHHMDAKVA